MYSEHYSVTSQFIPILVYKIVVLVTTAFQLREDVNSYSQLPTMPTPGSLCSQQQAESLLLCIIISEAGWHSYSAAAGHSCGVDC